MSLSMRMPQIATQPRPEAAEGRAAVLAKVWRRRGLFLAVAGGVMGLAVAAWLVMRPQYMATGSVIVAEQQPGSDNTSVGWIQKLGDPADIESQILLIRSPRLVRLALDDAKVADAALAECRYATTTGLRARILPGTVRPCPSFRDEPEKVVAAVQARFSASVAGRSRVINISYKSPLPEVAATMVNALIDVFLADQRDRQVQSRKSAGEWLRKEIAQLDASLRDDEAAIQAYRRKKGLMNGSMGAITSERLSTITQRLAAAEAAKAEAAARLKEIDADGRRGAADAPAVLASRTIADLKQQLSSTDAQLANAATSLGPDHPTIRALRTERASVSARIDREVANVADSLRKSYGASDALAASLRRELDTVKGDVASAMDDEAVLAGLTRNVDAKHKQYSDLVKRAGDLETEERILNGSSGLVNYADPPSEPFSPKPLPLLGGGFALAIVLGAAAALLRDGADRRVRAPSQFTSAIGAPVFAQLPHLQPPGAGSVLGRLADRRRALSLPEALMRAVVDPAMQDELRRLNARLLMADGEGGSRRILVTSAMPGEGKTFTALALAQLCATGRRRVLAIDGDLRRPNFAAAIDMPGSAGLAGILRGEVEPDAAVIRGVMPNLDLLPAGPAAEDSTELLMGPRMAALLDWSARYDLVLIDSPPAALLMDACVLAPQVDGVLCCARWGGSQVSDLVAAVGAIREAGGRVLGVAMTMAQAPAEPGYAARRLPNLGAA